MWNVELARSADLGVNDQRVTVRSHLGHMLKAGDLCECYDLRRINMSGSNDEVVEADHIDVVLVKREWASKKNKNRPWVLKRLKKEAEEDEKNANEDRDMDDFQRDIEVNPELRREMNLYRRKGAMPTVQESDGENSEPDVDLAELLEEMTLNENEE